MYLKVLVNMSRLLMLLALLLPVSSRSHWLLVNSFHVQCFTWLMTDFPSNNQYPPVSICTSFPKRESTMNFHFFLYGIETLIASLNDNYINNFIYDFFMFFFMISLCRKIMGHFQIYYLMIFLWLNLCFFLWWNLWFSFTWFRRRKK